MINDLLKYNKNNFISILNTVNPHHTVFLKNNNTKLTYVTLHMVI